MSSNNTIFSLIGYVLTIGASQVVGITVMPGQNTLFVQYLSGATIWVGGSTTSFGSGFLWDVSQIKTLSFEDFSSTISFAAGTTTQLSVMIGRRPDGNY